VLPQLLQLPNVVACGLGYKVSDGQTRGELSLIVSVTQKVPRTQLNTRALIPAAFNGLLTDVIETGHIRAQLPDPKTRFRPATPGISIGHPGTTAGTFGLLVRRDTTLFILSNNHVLANRNNAKLGDPIYQPGPLDGGTPADAIATLADFVPLDYGQASAECQITTTLARLLNAVATASGSRHRLTPVQVTPGTNLMDVALARLTAPELATNDIQNIGKPIGTAEPRLGQLVQKMGRTTGLTQGTVTQIDVTVNVDYGGQAVTFTDQIITTRMSSPGDSGSAILDMERKVVGLLFAGSETVTLFTPIQRILTHFKVQPVV